MTTVEGLFYLDKRPVRIEIRKGLIHSIVRLQPHEAEGSANLFVAPGLIDNQVNGYISVSFTSPGLSVAGVRKVIRALWQVGVTTCLPTVYTNSPARLLENFRILAEAVQDPEISLAAPGFHLEGPFISPEDGARGAHSKDWVRLPDWQEFQQLNEAAAGRILQVTLAPELEGALDFIRECVAENIVVALGHHNADAHVIKQAVDAGAAIATHLGNACVNPIHRHDNPLWPQLADDRLWASIIADGFHLRETEIQVFYKVKGPERTVLTSDIVRFSGMPPGEYQWEEGTIVLSENGMIAVKGEDMLAGSSVSLERGVHNMMKYTTCSLADAIHMASRNPAILNGLTDRGEIKPGKRADLILFAMNDSGLDIKKTIVAGKVVHAAD